MKPLLLASISGDVEAVQAELRRGEDVECRDETYGNTPLIVAGYNGHPELVRQLLGYGANIEAKCDLGETALVKAAWAGSIDCVQILVEAGANVNSLNLNQMTPLMIAAFYGRYTVVDTLLRAGADPTLEDEDGYLALDNAKHQGHSAIVKLLEPVSPEGLSPAQLPLFEASMNFDPEWVESFLVGLAELLDSGFTVSQAKTLALEIVALDHDAEKEWQFTVEAFGEVTPLEVYAFMDDIDAPDLAVFSSVGVARAAEKLMENYD